MRGSALKFVSLLYVLILAYCCPNNCRHEDCSKSVHDCSDGFILQRSGCQCCDQCILFEDGNCKGVNRKCDKGLICSNYTNVCVRKECTGRADDCTEQNCMEADQCQPGEYIQRSGHCGCCSKCVRYLDMGETCLVGPRTVRCKPPLKCDIETKKCVCNLSCSAVVCGVRQRCPSGVENLQPDPMKCRCCPECPPISRQQ